MVFAVIEIKMLSFNSIICLEGEISMKKVLTVFLIFVLVASFLMIPASAWYDGHYELYGKVDSGAVEKYLPKIFEQYENDFVFPEEGIDNREYYSQNLGVFEVVYDHKDENGEKDWTILHILQKFVISEGQIITCVIGGRELFINQIEYPFIVHYVLYDEKQGHFVSFYYDAASIFDDYEGLYEAWQTLDLSDITAEIVKGDANGDRNIDITDSTLIQRGLVGLESRYNIATSGADADSDGEVTVLDATRIQRVLAKLCNIDGNVCTE